MKTVLCVIFGSGIHHVCKGMCQFFLLVIQLPILPTAQFFVISCVLPENSKTYKLLILLKKVFAMSEVAKERLSIFIVTIVFFVFFVLLFFSPLL